MNFNSKYPYNILNLISLIWLFCYTQVFSLATLPAVYQNPILNTSSKIDITSGVNLNNTLGVTYDVIRSSQYFISRKTSTDKLQIFDISNNNLKYNLFSNTQYPSSDPILAYDIPDRNNSTLGVIENIFPTYNTYLYNLFNNGTVMKLYQITVLNQILGLFQKSIEVINTDVLILGYAVLSITSRIYRFLNSTTTYTTINTNFIYEIYNIKTCQVNLNDTYYKFAVWKFNYYVQVYNCVLGSCTSILILNNSACNLAEFDAKTDTQNLQWNSDCTTIIFQWKNTGLRIVSLSTNLTLNTYSMSNFGNSNYINNYWLIDDFQKYLGVVTQDGRFQIYDTSSNTTKVDEKSLNTSIIASYNHFKKQLMISKDSKLYLYSLGCSASNMSFQITGICIPLPINIPTNVTPIITPVTPTNTTVTNTTPIVTPNLTNLVNSTIVNTTTVIINNSTTINNNSGQTTTNSTNISNNTVIINHNITINQTNSQLIQTKHAQLPAVQPISTYEASIGQTTTDSFGAIGAITSYVISFLQYFPFTFLFMKFINFWSICSMYLFPNFVFPTYLRDVLLKIYQNINGSLFSILNINISINTNLSQKFSDQQNQIFGLTSDILNANIQSFLILIMSYIMLGLIYLLSKKLSKGNFVQKKLACIDYKMVVLAQYISIMNIFIFNLPIIIERGYQTNFNQKLNMVFHNLLFVFTSIIPCLTIIFVSKISTNKYKKQQNIKQRADWFIDSMCNASLPFIAIIRNIPFFLGVNLIFFLIPIYSALKQTKFRINKIIQSLYIPLFNLTVIGMTLFSKQNFEAIFHNLALLATLIIFIGAIHEILALIFGLIYELIQMLKCKNSIAQNNMNFVNKKEKISVQRITQQTQTPILIKRQVKFLKLNKIVINEVRIKKHNELIDDIIHKKVMIYESRIETNQTYKTMINKQKVYSFRQFKNRRRNIGRVIK